MNNIEKIGNNNQRDTINQESLNLFNEMRENEMNLINLQNYLGELKRSEINRISFEFLKKDYERRFSVSIDDIVSVIVGEDNTSHEISKQKREHRVNYILFNLFKKFYEQINKTKNYNCFEDVTKRFRQTSVNISNFSSNI